MTKFTIATSEIAGFTAADAKEGDTVDLIAVQALTSDDPRFYLYIAQLSDIYLRKVGLRVSAVSKFLVIHHPDNRADVFINDFPEFVSVKVNRDIEAGEKIFKSDISDIQSVTFPGVEIQEADAVVYCAKINWKFGLFFDYSRKIDLVEMSQAIGRLHKRLEFENYLARTEASLSEAKAQDLAKRIAHSVFVITEGKTDWKHIKNAIEKIDPKLNCTVIEFEDDRGDDDTLRMCEYYARVPHSDKHIFVFDRDNRKIIDRLDKMTVEDSDYQAWGNNVFSFMIPTPDHRRRQAGISIEFYYTDDEIRTRDSSGKRLHFSNELKTEILPGNVATKIEIEPASSMEQTKKIESDDASKIFDNKGKPVGLSKTAFAEKIMARDKGFDNFNFESFRLIIEVIRKISDLE